MFKKPIFSRHKTSPATPKSTSTAPKSTPAMITGQESERLAEQFLLQQGLTLVTRNYRCKAGEIDLIMQDREHLVFVEVRFRNNRRYGSASESVTHFKQQKLIRAAEFYLQSRYTRRQLPPCRFDVVAIDGVSLNRGARQSAVPSTEQGQTPVNIAHCSTNPRQNPIEWLPNAFTA